MNSSVLDFCISPFADTYLFTERFIIRTPIIIYQTALMVDFLHGVCIPIPEQGQSNEL